MNLYSLILFSLCLIFVDPSSLKASDDIEWPKANTVAYKAKKKMFLFKNVEIIGMNSNIAFSKSSINKGYILTVNIPIKDFKTDDSERDTEVQKLLGVDKQKILVFRSNIISSDDYSKLVQGKLSSVKGMLSIANKSYNVEFNMKKEDEFTIGEFESKFSYFDITPPKVALGVVAKAKDYIKLFVKINNKDL